MKISLLSLLLLAILASSCSKEPELVLSIDASSDSLVFTGAGGRKQLDISMNGSKWVVTSDKNWCTTNFSSSTLGYATLDVTVDANPEGKKRSAILTFILDSEESVTVKVVQGLFYPDYSNPVPPDASGMSSSATAIASAIFAGWNPGNSLEVPGGETGWGNPAISKRLIDSVKAYGINAVRIPCAWDSHLDDAATCKINSAWLNRVKEVVDYCRQNDMYVILNIHWDGGWLEENPTYAKQVAVNAKQKALWEQIAVFFRNYDEHLLFAGTNEVHTSSNPTAENYDVQLSYNQTFVDAVRSTGGKNATRMLIVQAYNTNIDQAVSKLVMPDDDAVDRLMAEVHYYDPWEFSGLEADASWGTVKNLWGNSFAVYGTISSWGQENYVQSQFAKMKSSFVDEGIPVILGEYGAIRRINLAGSELTHHLDSRAYYYRYITANAKDAGMVPFIWDNGVTGNLGFGLFNRNDGSVSDRLTLREFLAGAAEGEYPF